MEDIGSMSTPKELKDTYAFIGAFLSETVLEPYGSNALPLFSVGLHLGVEDLASFAGDSLTDSPNDKKADIIYINEAEGLACIAQGTTAEKWGKAEAPANKASDLNTAAAWLLRTPTDEIPEHIRGQARLLRDGLHQGTITKVIFAYAHNAFESTNVERELSATRELVRGLEITQQCDVEVVELGLRATEALYLTSIGSIQIPDEIQFPAAQHIRETGEGWEAFTISISGAALFDLYEEHTKALFSANLRDFLGARRASKNVNNMIKTTAENESDLFYIFNNGITIVCKKASCNSDTLTIQGISIVNGAQTTGAVHAAGRDHAKNTSVLARVIVVDDHTMIPKIVAANNTQNAIVAWDRRSNDAVQISSPWQKSRIRPGPGAAEPRRLHGMAMGKRPVARQASPLWVETADLPTSDGHPFFERLNRVLEDCGFDAFVEGLCSAFYAARMGRPSLRPGRYFRMLLIGYFEGLSSERGIAWRVADSLSLRSFLDLELSESAPDHSTLSRTRRLIDVETHEAVFTWVLERLSEAGLVVGKTVGIDATTLEANAAMRSIERRDTGESYEAFIRRLAEASGVETPTRAELARFDRSRKNKKTSNKEWKSPQDPDAKIAKMKDGRTHLAHKAEHGVDMDTGAIVSVTVQDASDGDTATLPETLIMAAEQVEAVQPEGAGVEEVVADKGYHSDETLVGLGEVGVRSHVSEPERGRRCWQDKKTGETPPEKRAAQKALYANRRRVRGRRGRRLQRRRGEVVERTFAHMYETGGMRRVWVRGHDNVRKRVLIQAAACNIGLLLRRQTGVGTPRSLQGRALSAIYGLIGLWRGCWERLRRVWGLKRSMLHLEAA